MVDSVPIHHNEDGAPPGRPAVGVSGTADARAGVQMIATVVHMARHGHFDAIRGLFAAPLRPLVSTESLRASWEERVATLGAVTSVAHPAVEVGPSGELTIRVPVTCEKGGITVVGTVNIENHLTGLRLGPPGEPARSQWGSPPYADPSRFSEQEVVVGSGPLAVPGTLSVPQLDQPAAAVVFLAGSGPSDRDGTVGPNKPLKDLAWGLASRGIVVARFDKVTQAHPSLVAADPAFTVVDEYVHHALAAIDLVALHPSVDPDRILLAGHSLGGTVAPRVAEANHDLAGLILLAAGATPIHWAAVRQIQYLARLTPGGLAASRPVIDTLTEQAHRVDSPDLSTATPATQLPFEVPAGYWLDLRTYQPAALAARLPMPILLLQGGRDYQVTVEDDLFIWRQALAARRGVSERVYAADDHFFMSGQGPSQPAELEHLRHVDPEVVADITAWIEGRAV